MSLGSLEETITVTGEAPLVDVQSTRQQTQIQRETLEAIRAWRAGRDSIPRHAAAVDAEGRWLYYVASPENATERYLYRSPIGIAGPGERLTAAGFEVVGGLEEVKKDLLHVARNIREGRRGRVPMGMLFTGSGARSRTTAS